MAAAISVENLAKSYRLGTIGTSTLGADLSRWWAAARGQRDPNAKVGQESRPRHAGGLFWALNDVSFNVTAGEVVGIIGRNGAGKSTLLKLLSQITAPTSGRIRYRGRIASLLEVGTGFHPELTGRENVFLNGSILGMSVSDIRRKFDEIVSFSECEEFLDTPVKRYSSGMYVRLAFSVAAHLDPDILIVDEVLAVGDAQFQRKCLGKIQSVSGHGRTVLFVSHSMTAVAALCSRAILLKDGRLQQDGDVPSVVASYQSLGSSAEQGRPIADASSREGSGRGRFTSLTITPVDREGNVLPVAVPGCDLIIELAITSHAGFTDSNVAVTVFDASGYRLIDVNMALLGGFLALASGNSARVTFRVADILLKPGTYTVDLWLGRGGIESMDHVSPAASLAIAEPIGELKHTETFPGVYQCRFTYNVDNT